MIHASEPISKQIAARLGQARLHTADGQEFELVLRELREVRLRAGWLRFTLCLRDRTGQRSKTPLMAGIVSGGGRGVMPWFEGRIYPSVELASGGQLDARSEGLEAGLIQLLGQLVPDGGHLMLEYESPGQIETHRQLLLGVPPAATHLGALMFRAGFRGHFKDWYISEGGNEGPRKLQANKSPNPAAAHEALHSNLADLREFLKRKLPQDPADAKLVRDAQNRARELLEEFGRRPRSPSSRASVRRRPR